MAYTNLEVFSLAGGYRVTDTLLANRIIVRRGGNDDWAAYYMLHGDNVRSGSLLRVSKAECDKYGVTAYMTAHYPFLRYRA